MAHGARRVYALQDLPAWAFRKTAEGIKFVRATIQRLPPRHPARWYLTRRRK